MNDYTLGPDGAGVCHYFEQCRLYAYPDPASPYAKAQRAGKPTAGLSPEPVTIGWGDTGAWKLGDTITQEQADGLFLQRMEREFEPAVRKAVKVEITQRQFDALVALAYNIGAGNFASSTLVKFLNQGVFDQAADQFLRWNKAGGIRMKGLDRRRTAERAVFMEHSASDAVAIAMKAYP